MRELELKPCPFCGHDAELSSGEFDGKETSYIVCKYCGSQGEFFFVSPRYASAIKAIEAWNRRVGDNDVKEAREGVWKRYDQHRKTE